MKITVKHNLDSLTSKLANMINSRIIERSAQRGLIKAGNMLADKIYSDNSIPEEYRNSVAVISIDNERRVVVGPVLDWAYILEKGTETSYSLYKCPKQKYFGGTIKRGFIGEPHLELIAQGSLNEIKDLIRNEINSAIRDEL